MKHISFQIRRIARFFLLSLLFVSLAQAQGVPVLSPIGGLSSLSEGRYVAVVSPVPDRVTANGIENALRNTPGVDAAAIHGGSSVLQITVEGGYHLGVGALQQVLAGVSPDLTMSIPRMVFPPAPNAALGAVQ